MKRNQFIIGSLAAIATPLQLFSKNNNTFTGTDKGFKVPAGEGRIHGHIQLKGVNANVLDLKISGSDSDGGMAVFEQTSLSQEMGTPLHVHHFQNEIFYVLEGDYFFKVGEDEFNLTGGDSIFLPQKIPHVWTQVSPSGKMEVIFQPAGKMENFFLTVAALDHDPTEHELAKLFLENEMEIVGPPVEFK